MSSLGYGDGPSAQTNLEYLWAITCQVLGACMYAAIFSNVAQLIAKLDAAGSRYSEELDRLTEFSTFYRLPRALANKLRAYNSFRFEVTRGFDIGPKHEPDPDHRPYP